MPIKIYIDQGHNPSGYHNSGAEGNGLTESEINYQVGKYLQALLEKDPRFAVRVSRPEPDTILGTNTVTSLAERVRQANEWPANYFLSIHANANPNPAINGTEIYIYQYYTQGQWLAEQIMSGITDMVGTKNNGIRERPGLYVLKNADMPANLIELGYLTNYADAEKLRNNQYQFAYGIYLGLLRYFGLTTT
jgi:N-acetylmuramoyl-L-alanine amidase